MPRSGPDRGGGTGGRGPLTAAAVALVVAAVAFTWYRLSLGCDLDNESFSVLVPWRWALGDRPFVDEMDLAQVAGLLTYPFVKAFTLVAGDSASGLVLFTRHLYLLFAVGVALVSSLVLRRLLRWELAVDVSAVAVTFVFAAVPNLTYNTLAMGLLALGSMLGLAVIDQGKGRRVAALAGVCHGLAVVAFPTLLFVMPFVALFLVLAHGRQARALVERLTWHVPEDPRPQEGPTGARAFAVLVSWVAGGLVPLALAGAVALAAGPRAVRRCWEFTLQAARSLEQLSGAAKAVDVATGLTGFILGQWPLLAGLVVVYMVYRMRPRVGRGLLALLPLALLAAGRRPGVDAAGLVLVYGLLAPYLYALLPRSRRADGAGVLIWVWPPAVLAAAMTAYTSANGFVQGAVGLFPAVLASGVFLAWNIEAAFTVERRTLDGCASGAQRAHAARTWAPFVTLAAVVAATVVLQFQYQAGGARFGDLDARLTSGPWAGVAVTQAQRVLLERYEQDLGAVADSGDALLVYFRNPGLYLYWPGALGADSVALQSRPADEPYAPLPQSTIAFYRRTRRLPDVVVHVCPAVAATDEQLTECGGLGYPVVVKRTDYAVNVRPEGVDTRAILDDLPRQP